MGKTPSLLRGMRKVGCKNLSDTLELGWIRRPHANGYENEEYCNGVWSSKNFPFLIGMRKVVRNFRSHALKFGWARQPPC